MERYLVIAPHTQEECVKVIKVIEAMGSVTRWIGDAKMASIAGGLLSKQTVAMRRC